MGIRAKALSAAAAIVLLLAGCGGGTEKDKVPFGSDPIDPRHGASDGGGETSDGGGATSDNGGDTQAAAPAIPPPDPGDYPLMNNHTPEGAEERVWYVADVLIWSYQTGDPSLLESISTDSCNGCRGQKETIENLRESGNLWTSPEIRYQGSGPEDSEHYELEAACVFTVENNVAEFPSTDYLVQAGFTYSGTEWLLSGLDVDTRETP